MSDSSGPDNPIVAIVVGEYPSYSRKLRRTVYMSKVRIPILGEDDYVAICADVHADPTSKILRVIREFDSLA